MSDFATLTDVVTLTGKEYSAEESGRIEALLPLVSDALRMEERAVGKNLDEMVSADSAYASVVKMVTVDVVARASRWMVNHFRRNLRAASAIHGRALMRSLAAESPAQL